MTIQKKQIKKVVLAYSGGLDTSAIIPWLKENYDNCEVIAFCADVGQGEEELVGIKEKAIASGASECYVADLKEEYVKEYIYYRFLHLECCPVNTNRYRGIRCNS